MEVPHRAEMPGPLKDNKMRPRIAETAKTLWLIYVLLTVACALALWFAGMDAFDAIGHSFATIAIGGFSTHDASIGYFDSPTINTIIAIFPLISGCNYGLHFSLLSGRSLEGLLARSGISYVYRRTVYAGGYLYRTVVS